MHACMHTYIHQVYIYIYNMYLVYIYIYIYIQMYIYLHIYIHKCMHAYIHRLRVFLSAVSIIHTTHTPNTHRHKIIQNSKHTDVHSIHSICTYMYIYVCVCMCFHTSTCIHSKFHTQSIRELEQQRDKIMQN